ncbi:ABC transporter ATP-binding protein [Vogesella fluminis]|uniref:ABC transporter n=1 Tax=Vogesella fluminis TaxID=1069161 RepID=A0ABQ3HA61_9NEIS|nr:ABC transporter ATP-binding protein [Vogesella fluminis]GHD78507.1 ABC transporter [Vogesella fluminis]
MSVITIKNVGKAYKNYNRKLDRLFELIIPFAKNKHKKKWVLQDIDFEVMPGEAVGILGLNGAGKSTLLKIISGTSKPTTGHVKTKGRVIALLELGMGFHPEFSGRQNLYLAGQLAGLSRKEIDSLMPEIEIFAEIGEYIDKPVKVYSSGMQVRLAFSLATAVRPDVLIVDEALSVGDAYFQHKCFDKIRKFRKEGTTLLIVSHDKAAIQAICDRAILLNAGKKVMEGSPELVSDYYNALIADKESGDVKHIKTNTGDVATISGTGEATVKNIKIINIDGKEIDVINTGQQVILKILVEIRKEIPRLILGYMIKDRLGQPVFGTNTHYLDMPVDNLKAGEYLSYEIAFDADLGEGSYSIATALVSTENHLADNFEWKDLALVFNVVNVDKPNFVGTTWMPVNLKIDRNCMDKS